MHDSQTIIDDEFDISIRYLRPAFQGHCHLSLFLGDFDYLDRHLVPVLVHLNVWT